MNRQPDSIILGLCSSKPFIEQRVTEIANFFPPAKWPLAPKSDNPADLLTRGLSTQQLLTSQL